MTRLVLPFHSYEHRARQVASRRLVNCYAEQAPAMAKAPVALLRAPGVRAWTTLPYGPARALATHRGQLYALSGNQLCRIDRQGTVAQLGTVTGTGDVTMVSNANQLVIVATPNGYVYDGTLSQITDTDFTGRGAVDVATVDSFALYVEPNSGTFFASDFAAANVIGGLSWGVAEGAPDDLVGILTDHRQIFLFGHESVEIWYSSGGDADFPFLREPNGFIEVGCGAPRAKSKADNAVFWIDQHRVARRLVDYAPVRVSTHGVEQQWESFDTIEDATAFAFVYEGHWFWCIQFPTAGRTFILDLATNEWHERVSRMPDGHDGAWRAGCHANCYGYDIVCDTETAALGIIDSQVFTEWGNTLRMEWTYPNVYADGRRAFHRRLQIDFQAGVGLTTGQGQEPEVLLYSSDDGGMTFQAVPNRNVGAIGRYTKRAVWHRLGSSPDRVYRAAVSDPVAVAVWDTQLEVEGGRL